MRDVLNQLIQRVSVSDMIRAEDDGDDSIKGERKAKESMVAQRYAIKTVSRARLTLTRIADWWRHVNRIHRIVLFCDRPICLRVFQYSMAGMKRLFNWWQESRAMFPRVS